MSEVAGAQYSEKEEAAFGKGAWRLTLAASDERLAK